MTVRSTGRPAPRWDDLGWRHRLAMVGSGAVAALGFAPLHIWGATLAALTVLFIRLVGISTQPRPGRVGFGTGLLFGLGWFSASCFWIASAFIERGPEFIPMIPPLVGGLAVLLSLFWGAAGWITASVASRGRLWAAALAFIGGFTLAELARGHVLSGFPWNMAAYAFEPGGAISQSAHWVGVYGMTAIAYAVAAGLGATVLSRKVLPGLAAIMAGAGLFGLGAMRLAGAETGSHPGIVLRLVAVPFTQSEKMDPDRSIAIVNDYLGEGLAPGLEDVTHIVWPEGAVNGLAIENEPLLRAMGSLLVSVDDTPPVWLMNSLRLEMSPGRDGQTRQRFYNSSVAVTFDREGNPAVAASNDKRKLVPFGEFIPGGEPVERLGAQLVSTALGSITPAPEKRAAQFPGLPPISPQICYEVIFPGLTPSSTDGIGAPQAILNQSNDAWFGATGGPAQHAAIARYRAIEEGLPLIRSAANGVSGVFDSYGRAERVLDGTRRSHLDAVLPLPVGENFAMRRINAALALFSLSLLLLAGSVFSKGRDA